MKTKKLDLESSLVSKLLRDKLFRTNPGNLIPDFLPLGELDMDDIAEIERSLINVGVLTPVLIDSDDTIVAGQGLVEAALQIGLEDIPVLRLEELTEDERPVFFRMMFRFYKLANIDWEVFQIDAQHILSFTASGRLALKIYAMKSAA